MQCLPALTLRVHALRRAEERELSLSSAPEDSKGRLLAVQRASHPAPRPRPPDKLRVRPAVRPARGAGSAIAQALLGLAPDPLHAVQQRQPRLRSGIPARRSAAEKKAEHGDA